MKSALLLAAAAATLSSAYAAFPVGDGSEAFITGDVGISYDDNIFLTATSAKSTAIYRVTPGLSFEFGTDALAKNILTLTEEFVRYSSASSQDNELARVNYTGKYSDEKVKIDFTAGYNEFALNTRDARLAGIIVEHTEASAAPEFEYILSPKTAFGFGANYMKKDYSSVGFTDSTMWSVPLNLYYEVAPKLQGSAGYRYRSITQSTGADNSDHYFNLGARGEFTPKLSGTFTIGYTDRDIERFGTAASRSESTVGIESKFDYAYSQKTQLRASFKNDFANSATGTAQELTNLSGGLNSALTEVLTADASLSYEKTDYIGVARTDDLWRLNLGATYKYNKYVSIKGEYGYQNNSSSLAGGDFKDNLFSVSASIRY